MWNYIKGWFVVYSTPRQVQIQSKLLAITYLVILITVWVCYLGSLHLDLRNVYQKSCPVQGAVLLKVKGYLSTEDIPDSEFKVSNPQLYKRVWDTSDLIFPPFGGDGQDGSFIAVTNLMITPNQSRGVCPESKKTHLANCTTDADCRKGYNNPTSHGVFTGKCDNATETCLISAWCPIEKDTNPLKGERPLLEGIQDFTLLIKNSVEFPECSSSIKRRNILSNATKSYLSSCIYSRENDTMCPIFKLGDIVNWTGSNFTKVAVSGAVFKVEVNWECDFDWSWSEKMCFPKYIFERIDVENAQPSPGWNFREAKYYEDNRRTLSKMYGLKILVVTTGNGRQFDFLQLILTLGATIGLFSVAPLFCDTLFTFLCYLKRFSPFHKWFGEFSVKSLSQEPTPRSSPNKFELGASNNTIEESVDSFNPSSSPNKMQGVSYKTSPNANNGVELTRTS